MSISRITFSSWLILSAICAHATFQTHELGWAPDGAEFYQTSAEAKTGDGKVKIKDIVITKKTDKSTPLLESQQHIDLHAQLKGTVVMGDGSVRTMSGQVSGGFDTDFFGTEGTVQTWLNELSLDAITLDDPDVAMRTRPGHPKPGKFTFDQIGTRENPLYNVDSFFDVFFDLSLDGGKTFQEVVDPVDFGIRTESVPEPATITVLSLAALAAFRRKKG